MPSLSWNEIRKRAIKFSTEWKDETSESAEAQTFWNEFFQIFGINRRRIASFEKSVKLLGDKRGSIDLFWKGHLIVEHKSRGKSLDKAFGQAIDYFLGLEDYALPKYVIVSDFSRFRIFDLVDDLKHDCTLEELPQRIRLFDFILGHTKKVYKEEDPVNIEAAELMGKLHDALKENGYNGHPLEVFLVRLMFCLFADDTGIFEKNTFVDYIENKTNVDGTDVGLHLSYLFSVLNTPEEKRQKNLDEDLAKFPYINGKLFEESLLPPAFNSDLRRILSEACYFDWSRVSPAIFGSLFQSVMDPLERRDFGAHYTSEKNILKAIKGLFLDDLWSDFKSHKKNKTYLNQLLGKIAKIKIFDPACGCGNFLIIAYRELRKLEIEIHKQLQVLEGRAGQQVLDVNIFNKGINVDSMYGIEILEFPVRIAEVALWLVDHQMNDQISKEFGYHYARLPLKTSPNIIHGNALRIDWDDIMPRNELSYIISNPPFAGKKRRNKEQNEDMKLVFTGIKNYGILDYVSSWYIKAAEYIRGTDIKVALVSTNSITQGEQVGVLWDFLLNKMGIKIHFAHRTFRWLNEARGKAQVFVVIIGFAAFDTKQKFLYEYKDPNSDPLEVKAKTINPYLVDSGEVIIVNMSKPISEAPKITFGSMPNDGGNFLFTDDEKNEFLKLEPGAVTFIKPFISAKEFINKKKRWCLWLKDASPSVLRKLSHVNERVQNVKELREKSKRDSTRKLAATPYLFGEIRQPDSGEYILIPLHSSENRNYIPMAFLSHENIANNSCSIIPNATPYHFGILTSEMHMAWMRQVCGRLEGRYRYSNNLVYNNFPWPENPTPKQIEAIEKGVRELFSVREKLEDSSFADLYDPLYMPKELLKAHNKLDKAVDKCYRGKKFNTELERLEFLFEMYDNLTRDET